MSMYIYICMRTCIRNRIVTFSRASADLSLDFWNSKRLDIKWVRIIFSPCLTSQRRVVTIVVFSRYQVFVLKAVWECCVGGLRTNTFGKQHFFVALDLLPTTCLQLQVAVFEFPPFQLCRLFSLMYWLKMGGRSQCLWLSTCLYFEYIVFHSIVFHPPLPCGSVFLVANL